MTPACCFLFDNGSLRAASTLALRRVAARLAEHIGVEVRAVSLLHSHRVSPAELGDQPAVLLESALAEYAEQGGEQAIALPLFFGPSGALVEYLPPRLEALATKYPHCRFTLAACLESPADDSARLLAGELACAVAGTQAGTTAAIVVCDHGSPLPTVTAVRNRIGATLPGNSTAKVASMERREGEEYAFNEPLLERALAELAGAGHREIVVALQFLFAGRHAGPGGDVAQICQAVEQAYPGLRTFMTEPIGESDAVLELLVRRYRQAVSQSC